MVLRRTVAKCEFLGISSFKTSYFLLSNKWKHAGHIGDGEGMAPSNLALLCQPKPDLQLLRDFLWRSGENLESSDSSTSR